MAEMARLQAENSALRGNCNLWRQRAEIHASATLGLLSLARSTHCFASKVKHERDELEHQFETLKAKMVEADQYVSFCISLLSFFKFRFVL